MPDDSDGIQQLPTRHLSGIPGPGGGKWSYKLSGIGVIFHRNGRLVRREEIEKTARALRPYGSERLVVKLAGPVAFAYAHMSNTPESIFDKQPFQSDDGRYVLVFDGRLDNRDDLRRDLDISVGEASTMSDGMLALASFRKYRGDAPARWVGDFAFIAWDKRNRTLFAARDAFGRRVLNWHETPDRIVIASAARGILALGDVPREIDEQKIADALGQLYHDQARSYFKNVKRLPHAQLMIADEFNVRFQTYWDAVSLPSIRFKSDAEYVEAAWEQLNVAVKAQMRSHGGVGAFMSGGWDSSTVAITAARFLAPDTSLPVFTSVPESRWDGMCLEEEYGDETPYVQAIARMHPQIELNLVPAEGLNQYHRQDEFLNAAEGPARNAVNLSWFHEIQAKARERGITTLLEGVMGNLTLTWHGPEVSREWFRKGQWARMLHHWWRRHGGRDKNLISFLPKAIWHELLAADAPEWLWRRYASRFEKASDGPRWRRFSLIDPDFASKMSLAARADGFGFNYFDRARYLKRNDRLTMLTTSFSNEVGPIYQGMRALHGIEIRDPLADRRLTEFTLGIPAEQFANHGKSRWLIKRMMADLLPQEITTRKGIGGRQCADWHSRMSPDLPTMKREVGALAGDRDIGAMIDTKRLGAWLEKWPDKTITSDADDDYFVFPIVIPHAMAIGRFVRLTKGAND